MNNSESFFRDPSKYLAAEQKYEIDGLDYNKLLSFFYYNLETAVHEPRNFLSTHFINSLECDPACELHY
ncbi:hypothetical protein PAJ34TS1_24750 [Paenibacillus azoreducens]|uniref:Uncharacterized protein n=1 Tax=Paenibacillus azoreducens TaxID=116718 RepID=A0A919YE13_9BACL|nr:hypothetical protein J34TS1_42220 [Paenibacillus azoreducens]